MVGNKEKEEMLLDRKERKMKKKGRSTQFKIKLNLYGLDRI